MILPLASDALALFECAGVDITKRAAQSGGFILELYNEQTAGMYGKDEAPPLALRAFVFEQNVFFALGDGHDALDVLSLLKHGLLGKQVIKIIHIRFPLFR